MYNLKRKKLPLFTFLIFIFTTLSFSQEISFSGKIVDGDTQESIDSVSVIIRTAAFHTRSNYLHTTTNSEGYYKFDSIHRYQGYKFIISLKKKNYKSFKTIILIEKDTAYNFELYKINSKKKSRNKDFASVDTNNGVFSFQINPPLTNNSEHFKSNYALSSMISSRIKTNRYNQLGFEFSPFTLVCYNLKNDTRATQIIYDKERYFGYYVSGYFYDRIILSNNNINNLTGLYIDLGFGYELPLYFKYIYYPEKNTKVSVKKIHKHNELISFLRIGYNLVSFKVSYRFFDVLKDKYTQLPKIQCGIEISLPSY